METIWICIYRDTIEEHDEDDNLAEVLVTEDFAKHYFNERINRDEENKITFEDFLNEYTADWTIDFYDYAKKHNAIIDVKPLYWEDIKENLLHGLY